MRFLQQVMCQRFALSLRVLFQGVEFRTNGIRLRFRCPCLDTPGQTMSDRSDSHFIQRPSSDPLRPFAVLEADSQRTKLASTE